MPLATCPDSRDVYRFLVLCELGSCFLSFIRKNLRDYARIFGVNVVHGFSVSWSSVGIIRNSNLGGCWYVVIHGEWLGENKGSIFLTRGAALEA